MNRSTGGERVGSEELRPFEGLVRQTARMFATQVGWEEDDLAQELRLKVWHAIVKYDPTRSKLSLERYVFGALTNKVKDFKRGASREVRRRETCGVAFVHIEDMRLPCGDDHALDRRNVQEAFDGLFNFVDRDDVYGRIEEGKFVLPAGVTDREASVLVLLMMEVSKAEIALRLGVSKFVVGQCLMTLRDKFADWAPDNSSRTIELSTVQTVRAEDQLVGSRAA